MDNIELAGLAFKHIKNEAAESLYLLTKYDITKPVAFYGLVNERCNVKCRYCHYWRLKHYENELTIEQWQNALLSIKELVGQYFINFSGGEPFVKQGFVDLLGFCYKHGIHSGVTTNGSLLTRQNAQKIVAVHPFNINISVDAPQAEIHDYLRGSPGLFEKLSNGIRYLCEERSSQNVSFPIIIKPTVNSQNFHLMPALVEWAQQIGATAINFQPLFRLTPETYNELWIEENQHDDLERIIERLCEMRSNGAPIMNSEQAIRIWLPHFCEQKAPAEAKPCRVGLRNYFINPNGDVKLCPTPFYPIVGNVKHQSAREIWYGEKAQEVREQTVACNQLCLSADRSQKTLLDKIEMGLKLLKK